MENRRIKERRGAPPANSARLEGLLDKLVAIQMDLVPAYVAGKRGVGGEVGTAVIVEVSQVLDSAIADLRNIIGEVHGTDDPPAPS